MCSEWSLFGAALIITYHPLPHPFFLFVLALLVYLLSLHLKLNQHNATIKRKRVSALTPLSNRTMRRAHSQPLPGAVESSGCWSWSHRAVILKESLIGVPQVLISVVKGIGEGGGEESMPQWHPQNVVRNIKDTALGELDLLASCLCDNRQVTSSSQVLIS